MRHQLHRKDLLWLLAYPLYQLIGSLRHEASHALVAVLQGARLQEFVFWPSFTGSAFRWGYVSWSGSTSWVATAAPYLCDLATFALFFVICARWPLRGHWLWVNLVAIGLLCPLV
ncbi:MAG: M50 family metallopeptidase, partial [Anaerolineae bacterium]|nr:M50 family metallopeptidase [Anaerolineae bacterium]